MITQKWISTEITFTATERVKSIHDASIDVEFKSLSTGTVILLPGFWDGGYTWRVRFAPTETGIWEYTVTARGNDIGLNNIKGSLTCEEYT